MAVLTMTVTLDLRLLALLSARLCHELSAPIGAVGNGVELLGENDPDFSSEAWALVQDNARRAANQLRFYRFCYGFGGDAAVTGPAPGELAAELFAGTPIVCDYTERVRALPLDWQKLGCNLLLVGAEALVRGGRLVLDTALTGLQLEVVGESAALAPGQVAPLRLETSVGEVTSRTVQAYFSGLLARALGSRLVSSAESLGRFRLSSLKAPDR